MATNTILWSCFPPSIHSFFSVVTIGFNQAVYRVNQFAGAVEVCASVKGRVELDRALFVQYNESDQSPVGMMCVCVFLYICEYVCVHLYVRACAHVCICACVGGWLSVMFGLVCAFVCVGVLMHGKGDKYLYTAIRSV